MCGGVRCVAVAREAHGQEMEAVAWLVVRFRPGGMLKRAGCARIVRRLRHKRPMAPLRGTARQISLCWMRQGASTGFCVPHTDEDKTVVAAYPQLADVSACGEKSRTVWQKMPGLLQARGQMGRALLSFWLSIRICGKTVPYPGEAGGGHDRRPFYLLCSGRPRGATTYHHIATASRSGMYAEHGASATSVC